MFESNPNEIQRLDNRLKALRPAPTPLVLFHDGGGTVFSYYLLGPLHRVVYGIYNPHYGTNEVWADGIPGMARHYLKLLREVIPKGNVILGGWSLGGLLSLEISRLLADDAKIKVIGIIMIDSVYPKSPQYQTEMPRIAQRVVQWSESTRQETREAVDRCFEEAGRMVREWTLPVWDPTGQKGREKTSSKALLPPPVILLRAKELVPVVSEGVSRVDGYRQDRYLGWEHYRTDLIVRVDDIPGHHFNIFSDPHVDIVTEKVRRACMEVESWARR